MNYLNGTILCLGIPLEEGETMSALIPHITGKLSDVTDLEKKAETRSFSSTCQIISNGVALHCANCRHLKFVDRQRKSRSEKRKSVNPRCNKRFLSKEEIMQQLKEETKLRKNAEMREQYWREKFDAEALEMDDQDQQDLISIFKDTNKEGLPPDMKCLWEQQEKILNTSSKNGYRWHPKYVCIIIRLYMLHILRTHYIKNTLRIINAESNFKTYACRYILKVNFK